MIENALAVIIQDRNDHEKEILFEWYRGDWNSDISFEKSHQSTHTICLIDQTPCSMIENALTVIIPDLNDHEKEIFFEWYRGDLKFWHFLRKRCTKAH